MSEIMQIAYEMAKISYEKGEVPVGAVLYHPEKKQVLAKAHNLVITNKDPLAHAEMLVIQEGLKKTNETYLQEYDLYVTLEPCPLCASALALARIRRVYFGAYDPKSGGVEHGPRIYQHPTCHHKPEIYGGILEQECAELMQSFFQEKRS